MDVGGGWEVVDGGSEVDGGVDVEVGGRDVVEGWEVVVEEDIGRGVVEVGEEAGGEDDAAGFGEEVADGNSEKGDDIDDGAGDDGRGPLLVEVEDGSSGPGREGGRVDDKSGGMLTLTVGDVVGVDNGDPVVVKDIRGAKGKRD